MFYLLTYLLTNFISFTVRSTRQLSWPNKAGLRPLSVHLSIQRKFCFRFKWNLVCR